MGWFEVTCELIGVVARCGAVTLVAIFRCIFPKPYKCVRDKVILVTGAGGYMGRLLAQKFALLGAHLILVDVDQEKNNETLQTLLQMQCTAHAYICDVSNDNQVEELADKVRRDVGDVDILINNAGVLPGKSVFDLSNRQIRRTMEINALSHFWLIRQFLPRMLERGEGHIVAIASIAGMLGCSYLVDYCASKFAVVGMMSSLREELYETGTEEYIKLTVVCPSTINTGLVKKPKTRFPILFPILDPDKTADTIVSSVLREKTLVVLPTFVHGIYKIANLFPPQVPLILQRFLEYTLDPNVK